MAGQRGTLLIFLDGVMGASFDRENVLGYLHSLVFRVGAVDV